MSGYRCARESKRHGSFVNNDTRHRHGRPRRLKPAVTVPIIILYTHINCDKFNTSKQQKRIIKDGFVKIPWFFWWLCLTFRPIRAGMYCSNVFPSVLSRFALCRIQNKHSLDYWWNCKHYIKSCISQRCKTPKNYFISTNISTICSILRTLSARGWPTIARGHCS